MELFEGQRAMTHHGVDADLNLKTCGLGVLEAESSFLFHSESSKCG